jgi:hypothetical protein
VEFKNALSFQAECCNNIYIHNQLPKPAISFVHSCPRFSRRELAFH